MTRLTTNLTIVALGFALLASPATSHACKGGRRARYAPPQVYYAPPQYQRPCPPRVVQAPPPASQAIGQFPTQGLVPQNGIQIPGTQVRTQGGTRIGTQIGTQTGTRMGTQIGTQAGTPAGTQMGGLAAMGQTQTSASAASSNTAEMTALQVLTGMSADQAPSQQSRTQATGSRANPASGSPAASASTSSGRVGTWVAQLPNQASVRLNLRADGSFIWTATKSGGKESNFQGSYRLDARSLTLVRGDSQQLAGTLTDTNGGFNFNLNGTKDSGLNFTRAS
jgi:hypothetical protein